MKSVFRRLRGLWRKLIGAKLAALQLQVDPGLTRNMACACVRSA
jgi:hypothetical protein